MREIKFRGKRVDNGEWVFGDLIHRNEMLFINVYKTDFGYYAYEVPAVTKTVGQFTGLKDKNGKEIYEGYVVLCDRHINDAFDKTTFLIGIDEYFRYQGISKLGNEISVEEFEYAEVIGNIHDNKELL